MLVPIIQYSSLFVKTPTLAFFYSNKEIKSECARFCTLNKGSTWLQSKPTLCLFMFIKDNKTIKYYI